MARRVDRSGPSGLRVGLATLLGFRTISSFPGGGADTGGYGLESQRHFSATLSHLNSRRGNFYWRCFAGPAMIG